MLTVLGRSGDGVRGPESSGGGVRTRRCSILELMLTKLRPSIKFDNSELEPKLFAPDGGGAGVGVLKGSEVHGRARRSLTLKDMLIGLRLSVDFENLVIFRPIAGISMPTSNPRGADAFGRDSRSKTRALSSIRYFVAPGNALKAILMVTCARLPGR